MYPRMLYADNDLSRNRIVRNEADEAEANSAGFFPWGQPPESPVLVSEQPVGAKPRKPRVLSKIRAKLKSAK